MSFEEKLIEAVRENEILYNLKDRNYRITDIKDRKWNEIAKNLNSTSDKCRQKWKGLGDTYRRIKREMQLPSGSKSKTTKVWKYFEQMMFLDNFECSRETIGNYSSSRVDNEDDEDIFQEYFDTWNDVDLSTSSVATPAEVNNTSSKRIRKQSETSGDPLHKKFCELIDLAQDSISSAISNKNNTTLQHFEVLAKEIIQANLPASVRINLKSNFAKLVHETL